MRSDLLKGVTKGVIAKWLILTIKKTKTKQNKLKQKQFGCQHFFLTNAVCLSIMEWNFQQ